MKKTVYILSVIAGITIACNSGTESNNTQVEEVTEAVSESPAQDEEAGQSEDNYTSGEKFYRDFDYVNLEGVEELDPNNLTYPYMSVTKGEGFLRIHFLFNEPIQSVFNYMDYGDVYMFSDQYTDPSYGAPHRMMFCFKDGVAYEFMFQLADANTNCRLMEALVADSEHRNFFRFGTKEVIIGNNKNDLEGKFRDLLDMDYLNSQSNHRTEESFDFDESSGKWIITRKETNENNELIHEVATTYETPQVYWFWDRFKKLGTKTNLKYRHDSRRKYLIDFPLIKILL